MTATVKERIREIAERYGEFIDHTNEPKKAPRSFEWCIARLDEIGRLQRETGKLNGKLIVEYSDVYHEAFSAAEMLPKVERTKALRKMGDY